MASATAQGRPQNSRDDRTVASRRGSQRNSLQLKIRNIAMDAHGKVSVACALPGDEVSCDLNPNATPLMQSVFRLPLALAVLHCVEQGSLSLAHLFTLSRTIGFCPKPIVHSKTGIPKQTLMILSWNSCVWPFHSATTPPALSIRRAASTKTRFIESGAFPMRSGAQPNRRQTPPYNADL